MTSTGLRVLETATAFDLPDERVVLAGDWHGNMRWVQEALPAAARTGVSTILHVGDFGFWPGSEGADFLHAVDHWARQVRRPKGVPGIERILATLGNHEDYDGLDRARDEAGAGPAAAVRVSEVVWALPRPFAFTVGGRSVLSFGGAASIDYASRYPGRSWWPGEMPREAEVAAAEALCAEHRPFDVLVTHEAGDIVTGPVSRIVTSALGMPDDYGWGRDAYDYAAESRRRIARVQRAARPLLHAHGHYHVHADEEHPAAWGEGGDRREMRVLSLGMDEADGNLALLDLASMGVQPVPVGVREGSSWT